MALADRLRSIAITGLGMLAGMQPAPAQGFAAPTTIAEDAPAAPPERGVRPWKSTRRRPRITPLPINRTRWLQSDIETAILRASSGDMSTMGQLYRSFLRDGTIQGVLGTRTGGLIRLPKRFLGTPKAVEKLEGSGGKPGKFSAYFPPAELARFVADGVCVGLAVGQFVQGELDKHPVFVRLDPEFLIYRWSEDKWYYRSLEGLLLITPGDGRWVLHTPHGRNEPWNYGNWQALARAYVSKEHALLHRENYSGKLANPARVAVAPQGAGEPQKQSWFRSVMAWGVNSVFGVTPGYDVKLVESNGRGYEVFQQTIDTSDHEIEISIAGQSVQVDGGSGFQNNDIHETIRTDLIQGDGEGISSTLNTQALPFVVYDLCGPGEEGHVSWDTRPANDLTAAANSLTAASTAITSLTSALTPHGLQLDVSAVCARFAVPIKGDVNGDAVPDDGAAAPPPELPPPPPTPMLPAPDEGPGAAAEAA